MAFGSHLLVNLTICVIIFAFISCVEAALNDSGESRSLHFFLYLLYSYLGVVGVHADSGDPVSEGTDIVDAGDHGGHDGYCS